MIVLLDTSILMAPAKFGFDIFAEIQRIVPEAEVRTVKAVVDELRNVSDKRSAKVALEMIEKFNIPVDKSRGNADTALLRRAKKEGAIVCTNDAELRKRCLRQGVAVIFMRKKSILQAEGLK